MVELYPSTPHTHRCGLFCSLRQQGFVGGRPAQLIDHKASRDPAPDVGLDEHLRSRGWRRCRHRRRPLRFLEPERGGERRWEAAAAAAELGGQVRRQPAARGRRGGGERTRRGRQQAAPAPAVVGGQVRAMPEYGPASPVLTHAHARRFEGAEPSSAVPVRSLREECHDAAEPRRHDAPAQLDGRRARRHRRRQRRASSGEVCSRETRHAYSDFISRSSC